MMTSHNISHFNISLTGKKTACFELTTRSGGVLCIEGPLGRVKPIFDAVTACFGSDDESDDFNGDDDGTDEEEIHPVPFDLPDDTDALASAGFSTDADCRRPSK